ncbi:D-alanyl-D-alanine carboxypeptidase/D-alanyl-D-alanine-endopeptidase [Deinococcus sp. RIT780]|uniref:D-alanyl-D-alanine carboxypeptidase/D-alanyl-D-alanine-endopeptidase n=1 Tax=Deinococcus sp. RIT780 TaxID=2870472 RepID=UPI001C8B01FA|nr:D-alanyl-D-alanine carboxypeptidase [Deinococcus sp. RIT780]MBX8466619.1 D-alanyl-D-alanine carboxypeptidase [Deinococcus sp. RIT780]
MRRLLLISLLLLPVSGAQAPARPAPASPETASPETASSGAAGPDTALQLTREPGLSAGVRAALRGLPPGVRVGVLLREVGGGPVLETQAADETFIPASTVKLVTAAAVLAERGGADGEWTAELTVPAAQAGRADVKAVTLRGSGDPLLSARDGAYSLRGLARQAYARGLRSAGEVRLDDAGLNAPSFAPLTLGEPMPALRLSDWQDDPPASVDEARARLAAALIGELRRAGVTVTRDTPGRAAPFTPYLPPTPPAAEGGRPAEPDPFVPVDRRPEQGVASVRSGSPFRVLARTLRPSDNRLAEALLSTLAHPPGGNGTLTGALARERAFLRQIGVNLAGVRLADGSGLGREARLSPRALGTLLTVMHDLPYPTPAAQDIARSSGPGALLPDALYRSRGNAFIEALPQAGTGEDVPAHDGRGGTLALRMRGLNLDVRAKTGTLPGVSALAGYVTGRSGRTLVFAVLMNGSEDTPILTLRAVQDRVVQAMAQAH